MLLAEPVAISAGRRPARSALQRSARRHGPIYSATTRFLPCSLAWYMAVSARLIMLSRVSPSWKAATPKLPVTRRGESSLQGRPERGPIWVSSIFLSLSAQTSAPARGVSGWMMMNSSPP